MTMEWRYRDQTPNIIHFDQSVFSWEETYWNAAILEYIRIIVKQYFSIHVIIIMLQYLYLSITL